MIKKTFQVGEWVLAPYEWYPEYGGYGPALDERNNLKNFLPFKIAEYDSNEYPDIPDILELEFVNKDGRSRSRKNNWFSYDAKYVKKHILTDLPCELCGCFCFQTCKASIAINPFPSLK